MEIKTLMCSFKHIEDTSRKYYVLAVEDKLKVNGVLVTNFSSKTILERSKIEPAQKDNENLCMVRKVVIGWVTCSGPNQDRNPRA